MGWESKISHKEVVQCLKDFHKEQNALLDSVLKEDHLANVKAQTAGWELFDKSVDSCKKSVEKSEHILQNGARALWISFHNPPISLLSQSSGSMRTSTGRRSSRSTTSTTITSAVRWRI